MGPLKLTKEGHSGYLNQERLQEPWQQASVSTSKQGSRRVPDWFAQRSFVLQTEHQVGVDWNYVLNIDIEIILSQISVVGWFGNQRIRLVELVQYCLMDLLSYCNLTLNVETRETMK